MPKILQTNDSISLTTNNAWANDAGVSYEYTSAASLVGWWVLDENVSSSGTYRDLSTRGNTGTFDDDSDRPNFSTSSPDISAGSALYDVDGGRGFNIGSAATWDALIGSDTASGSTQKMTFACWVRANADFDSDGRMFWLGDPGATAENGVGLYTVNRKLFFRAAWSAPTNGGNNAISWTADEVAPRNLWTTGGTNQEWVHVVVTYDANDTSNIPVGYINGERFALSLYPPGAPPAPGGTYIGPNSAAYVAGEDVTAKQWDGNMAEAVIWNSILTHDEIRAIYYRNSQVLNVPSSGYLNNPARVLLQDLDNRPGAYPPGGQLRSAIAGSRDIHSPTAMWRASTPPFDDTNTINFEDPFAQSVVEFSRLPNDARFIRLTDGAGRIVTFEFQRGVILREGSVAIDLTGRTKAFFRKRRAYLQRKIRNATPGSKYRKIDTQNIKHRVWAEFTAERFAKAVNEFTGSLSIRAVVQDNKVTLRQLIPGTVGNTDVYTYPPNSTAVAPTSFAISSFTGGADTDIIYPLGASAQYLISGSHPMLRDNPLVATPNKIEVSASLADSLELSPAIRASAVARKGVADYGRMFQPRVASAEDAYEPYVDSRVFLDAEDDFFDEGVPEAIVQDFNSPLRDKVMIVIDINPRESTTFGFPEPNANANNSDPSGIYSGRPQHIMVYYNFAESKWEGLRGITCDINEGTAGHLNGQYETALREFPIGFSRGVELNAMGLKSACRPIDTYGFPFHPKFHATGSQTLKMGDYIDAPFVFEKYVLEFSGSYSSGGNYPFLQNMLVVDDTKTPDGVTPSTAKMDNGECWGEAATMPDGTSGGTGWLNWGSYFSERLPRASINSFFILRQERSSQFQFEYDVEGIGVDNQAGAPPLTKPGIGEVTNFNITGSVPGWYPITPFDGTKLTYVDTNRELVTYGQWSSIADAPGGEYLPQLPYTSLTGALEQGLSRELNTFDLGFTGPSPIYAGYQTNLRGKFHYHQPCPTGSYVMRGKVKKPIAMSGSFATWYGKNNTPELQFNPTNAGNRYGYKGMLSSGRGLVRDVPGQKIAGTVQDVDYSHEDNKLRGSYNTRAVNVFEFDDTSPYILLPEDELVLGWQAPMPFGLNRVAAYSSTFNGHATINASMASGPNMGLHPGKGRLILYGSLIRKNKEALPSLRQQLTSDAIHQVIGNDPIFDEFDISPSSAYYGTMANELVTGSMKPSDQGDPRRGARGVEKRFTAPTRHLTSSASPYARLAPRRGWTADGIQSMGASGSLGRVLQLRDSTERYYDTMVGDPLDYQLATNPTPIGEDGITNGDLAHPMVLAPYGTRAAHWQLDNAYHASVVNTRWMAAFPFEGFYDGKVDRLVDWSRWTEAYPGTDTSISTESPPKSVLLTAGVLPVSSIRNTGSLWCRRVITNFEGDLAASPRFVNKVWFGVGDGLSGSCDVHQVGPEYRGTHIDNANGASAWPSVRGWKYGIMNAYPVRSQCVFRRDRFGQFRDMLEQRHDSRFFNEEHERRTTGRRRGLMESAVRIKFVDSDTGDVILAEDTHSQNLSMFATASLPYFDGMVRERNTDPDENEDFVVTL